MDETERREILRRINRQSATIGASIPDTITVGGDELALSEFIIETRKLDRIPPETKDKLKDAKQILREERERRVTRIENEDLDRETAEEIADEVVGIDRALNALTNIRQPSFGERSRAQTIRDYKKWVDFLDTVRD